MYDVEGTEKIVASDPITFPNPVGKGDSIYISGKKLLVERVAHNLDSGISWLEISHRAEDLGQEATHLEAVLKKVYHEQLRERAREK
jgi:hypothetical protein